MCNLIKTNPSKTSLATNTRVQALAEQNVTVMATIVMRSSEMKYWFKSCDVLECVHANTAQEDGTNQWQASERAVVHDEGPWNSLSSSANANLGSRQKVLGRHQPPPPSGQRAQCLIIKRVGGGVGWGGCSLDEQPASFKITINTLLLSSVLTSGGEQRRRTPPCDSFLSHPRLNLCQSRLQSGETIRLSAGFFFCLQPEMVWLFKNVCGFTFSWVEKDVSRRTSWTVTPHVPSVHRLEAAENAAECQHPRSAAGWPMNKRWIRAWFSAAGSLASILHRDKTLSTNRPVAADTAVRFNTYGLVPARHCWET